MVQISCRVSSQFSGLEIWPSELPERPCIGDRICSGRLWKNDYRLELEVYHTRWIYRPSSGDWTLEVELHLPRTQVPFDETMKRYREKTQ